MNILNCLRSRVDYSIVSSVKRSYTMCYRASVIHNKHSLSSNQLPVQVIPNRCFMKKMGLKPIYDMYNKKAAKDGISSTEYELLYQGTGEVYVRWLSGIVVVAMAIVPSVFIFSYLYIVFTEGKIDLKTYLDFMFIPNSLLELAFMLPSLFLLKLASYSFISKYVLRIYRHNSRNQYVSVYIHPVLPWKNITCSFDKAIKLPNGKNFLVPWHKEYYRLAGYKSIVLKERFRRPVDYDRMLGLVKTMDD